MADIPSHPDAIQPDWLTERLRTAGLLADGRVTAIRWEAIGTGQVGDSARFHLSYDREGAGPATVAGKFPAEDQMSRGTAAAFGLYAKEVGFYRELAPLVDVRVPKVLAAEIAEDGVDFILLFEDLGPARKRALLLHFGTAGKVRAALGKGAAKIASTAAIWAASWASASASAACSSAASRSSPRACSNRRESGRRRTPTSSPSSPPLHGLRRRHRRGPADSAGP